jgi:hypothetical protein
MMPPSCQRDPLAVADLSPGGGGALPALPVLREYLLKVSFIVARVRLVSLISGGSLVPASIDAYTCGLPVLVPGVPAGDLPAAPITVRIPEPTDTAGVVILPLRWRARGAGGQLVRVLDAELMLVAATAGRTLLRLEGEFRLPFAISDRSELPRRAATASMNYLLDHVRRSLAGP